MAKKKSTEPADAVAPEVTKVEIPIEETPEAPAAENVQSDPTEPEHENESVSDNEATEPNDDAAPEQAPVVAAEESATPVIPAALSSMAFVMLSIESAMSTMEFLRRSVLLLNASIISFT